MEDTFKPVQIMEYLQHFQCIGGVCEDNCCIGWSVEIDKKTYHKYQKLNNTNLEKLIQQYVYENQDCYDPKVDYALVELKKNKNCPFLNDQFLCKIQAELGESYLSNVCGGYPRLTNEINGVMERSATVSCPEIARIALGRTEGLSILDTKMRMKMSDIISISVNTKKENSHPLVKYLLELRGFTIRLLQNRSFLLPERILILGEFYENLQDLADTEKMEECEKLMARFQQEMESGKIQAHLQRYKKDLALKEHALKAISDRFDTPEGIDSQRYLDWILESKKNARGKEEGNREFDYVIENYLVNYVFQSLFPASESELPFEAFQKLAIRFALIQFHLDGIRSTRQGLTEESAIQFIQVFSKALEHHYSYFEDICVYLRAKGFKELDSFAPLIL